MLIWANLRNVKSHCAYFDHDKCKQEGEYVWGRMTFPDINAARWTDFNFLTMTNEEHHWDYIPLASWHWYSFAILVCAAAVRQSDSSNKYSYLWVWAQALICLWDFSVEGSGISTGMVLLPVIVCHKAFNHFLLLSASILLFVHPVCHKTCNGYAYELYLKCLWTGYHILGVHRISGPAGYPAGF
jgi:hypothetical protein